MQQSPYTPDEIIEMINSDDLEENAIGARNLWTFWEKWPNQEIFKSLGSRLHYLLNETMAALPEGFSGSFRPVWHFLLSLGCLQYSEAYNDIFAILANPAIVENIRGFAADALARYPPGSLTKEQEEILWKLAEEDSSLPVRVNCIRAIASNYFNSRNENIAKRLWEMQKIQSNPAIKSTIMAAIGDVASTAIVPELIHTLITRRTPAMKKDAGLTLDRIAQLNGMKNRDDLIKSFSKID